MKCEIILVDILVATIILLSFCDARGGRRGGSFGGLFGSWRKYKKPSTGGGSSRRIVSSSPVHTPITKAWHENKKTGNSDKFQKNFKTNNFYNGYTPPLPTGGSYYQNAGALPGNAIYVAQAPPRGAEFGDFLTGYLTSRLLTMGFSTPHYHVTHVYGDSPSKAENDVKSNNSSQFIVLNNHLPPSTENPFNTPLFDFSTTTQNYIIREDSDLTTEINPSTTEIPTPPYGVICVPMLIAEINANGENVQNERTVCYPAPAPPPPQENVKTNPVEIAGDITEH